MIVGRGTIVLYLCWISSKGYNTDDDDDDVMITTLATMVMARRATTLTMMATTGRATTSTEVDNDGDGAKLSSPSMHRRLRRCRDSVVALGGS